MNEDWHVMFLEIQRFIEQYRHSYVTKDKNSSLYEWTCRQREEYASSRMMPDRVARLKKIGFVLEPVMWGFADNKQMQWQDSFEALIKYKQKYGSARVSRDADRRLYEWTMNQVRYHRDGKMSKEHAEDLAAIGFEFDTDTEEELKSRKQHSWDERFQMLQDYQIKKGHCDISSQEDATLYQWVAAQRARYRNHTLSQDRINKLSSIGFIFEAERKRKTRTRDVLPMEHIKRLKDEMAHRKENLFILIQELEEDAIRSLDLESLRTSVREFVDRVKSL